MPRLVGLRIVPVARLDLESARSPFQLFDQLANCFQCSGIAHVGRKDAEVICFATEGMCLCYQLIPDRHGSLGGFGVRTLETARAWTSSS
jgi:hypothetical protein